MGGGPGYKTKAIKRKLRVKICIAYLSLQTANPVHYHFHSNIKYVYEVLSILARVVYNRPGVSLDQFLSLALSVSV